MELSEMEASEIDGRLQEIEAKIDSVTKYLTNTTKSYKKVRQMRGAAAHKKGWEFEALMKRYETEIETLRKEAEALKLEKLRRMV